MTPLADLLRLLAVPVLGWAAYRDHLTRRVPNRTWYPLAVLGVGLLLWDGWSAFTGPPWEARAFAIRVAVSIGIIVPLAVGFHRLGGFGGADAKAFVVLAVLFPTYPAFQVAGLSLPTESTTLGVFSLTVLSNTVLVGLAFPIALAARNALGGDVSPAMLVGRPVRWDMVPTTHGRLLETPRGATVRGLDLDALRMYLRFRGLTLADVRADPDRFRDPGSLPERPNAPTDGAVDVEPVAREPAQERATPDAAGGSNARPDGAGPADDQWGAATFLDTIDHGAYGTTPSQLRDGLDLLAREERVWISPGLPFLVPLFVGLLVSITYGDVLFVTLRTLGFV